MEPLEERTNSRPEEGNLFFSIRLEEVKLALVAKAESFSVDEAAKARIEELERVLSEAGENLQTIVEEIETSNEELPASNEEMHGLNEEYQAKDFPTLDAGANYFAVCACSSDTEDFGDAQCVMAGIRSVLSGRSSTFEILMINDFGRKIFGDVVGRYSTSVRSAGTAAATPRYAGPTVNSYSLRFRWIVRRRKRSKKSFACTTTGWTGWLRCGRRS